MTQEAVTSYEDTQPCGGQPHTQLGGRGLLDNQIGQQFDFLLSELHASDAPEGREQSEKRQTLPHPGHEYYNIFVENEKFLW